MAHRTTHRPFRTAIVTFAIALATTAGASADVLTPLEDAGGPGGGSGYGGQYDELLAGSGYESAAAQTDTPAAIAASDDTRSDGAASSQEDVLAGSGYEQPAGTFAKNQNTRSIEMTESKEAPGGIRAGGTAPSARVPFVESEHAQAQGVAASTDQSPQASRPFVTF